MNGRASVVPTVVTDHSATGEPFVDLVARLQRSGWGDLGGAAHRGLAQVLLALADVLDPRSGAGRVTARQLAGMTCYTERWVRHCLAGLEELDLIEWHRGGSWVRVHRLVLESYIAAGSAR